MQGWRAGTKKWLAVERFDTTLGQNEQEGRIHMHSACGLLDADFRIPRLDYADLIKASSLLCKSPAVGQAQFILTAKQSITVMAGAIVLFALLVLAIAYWQVPQIQAHLSAGIDLPKPGPTKAVWLYWLKRIGLFIILALLPLVPKYYLGIQTEKL